MSRSIRGRAVSDEPGTNYTQGHHESVLRGHHRRTAEDSAAYLLPYLRPGLSVLDIGCGPGTITGDLAALVAPGPVTAVDQFGEVLDVARAEVQRRNLSNIRSPPPTSTDSTSPTTPSTSSTPIRCCSTSPTRWARCARCGACAGRAGSWRPATPTTRDSCGIRCFPSWTCGWSSTRRRPAPTAANPTQAGGCGPGRSRPGSPTSRLWAACGAMRRPRRGSGGVGCGPTGLCIRGWRANCCGWAWHVGAT